MTSEWVISAFISCITGRMASLACWVGYHALNQIKNMSTVNAVIFCIHARDMDCNEKATRKTSAIVTKIRYRFTNKGFKKDTPITRISGNRMTLKKDHFLIVFLVYAWKMQIIRLR